MKNVLITGGGGFIGANLVRRLILDPHFKVFVIEKSGTDVWRLKHLERKISIKYVDLRDKNKLCKVINTIKPHIVFHLASYGVYPAIQNDVETMIDTNIKGTLHLIESLKKSPLELFVNMGSSGEYKEKKSSINEDDRTDPLNFYAITKLTATLLLKKIAKENNLPIINVRLFTPYGYYEDDQRLIPYIILHALHNKKVLLSSPDSVRDFIFIEDIIDVFLKMIKSNKKYQGEIFNVGSGKQYSVGEIANLIGKLMNKRLDISYGKRKSYYQEPKFFQADNNRVKHEFHWKVNYDIASGITKTIDWFKKQQ